MSRGVHVVRTLIVEMVSSVLIDEHAVRIIHETLWWAEVDLGTICAIVVPRYGGASRHIRLRVSRC
jgi:hypothetical protein